MQLLRRRLVATLAIGLAAASITSMAAAQGDWPSRPLRLVVPFAAGGPADNLARFIGKGMSAELGQTIVIDNKGGGGGTLGAGDVARAKDGYSFLFSSTGALVIVPALTSNLPYNPERDLVAIGQAVITPSVFVVSAKSPIKTFDELVAFGRANPGKLNFASAGSGTSTHLVVELAKRDAKFFATHIPYRGAAPAVTDLIGGQVEFFAGDVPAVVSFIQGGQLRALAVASTTRSPALPDVPTTGEAKLPTIQGGTWYGLMGPTGTPPEVVAKLNAALNKVLAQPESIAYLKAQGAVPVGGTAAAFGSFVKSEATKWGGLAKEVGVKLD